MDRSVAPGDNFYAFGNGTVGEEHADPRRQVELRRVQPAVGPVRGSAPRASSKPRRAIPFEDRHRLCDLPRHAGDRCQGAWRRSSLAGQDQGGRPRQPIPRCWPKPASAASAARSARVGQDDKNPEVYALSSRQSGLGLPDRDYYLTTDAKLAEAKTAYQAHIAKMLTLAGEANADARAEAIVDFETADRPGQLDPDRQPRRRQDLQQDDASPIWRRPRRASTSRPMFKGLGAPVDTRHRRAAERDHRDRQADRRRADRRCCRTSCWCAASTVMPTCCRSAFDDEHFAFYGTDAVGHARAAGALEARRRSSPPARSTTSVARSTSQKYFPPATKAAADQLVKNIIAAMDARIDKLTWMAPETKVKAHAKLAAFTPKIGYPSQWQRLFRADDRPGRRVRQRMARERVAARLTTSPSSASRSTAGNGA